MKKILFVVESLGGGGAEKVLLTLIKNLNKIKYDITVYTIVETGVYVNEMKKYCRVKHALKANNDFSFLEKVLYKIKYKLIYSLNTKLIYKLLIKNKYDIEIGFVEGFATKFVASSNNNISKKIAWVHTDMLNNPYADRYYANLNEHKKTYERYNEIISVSETVKKTFEQKFGVNDVSIIYNPIDINNSSIENYHLNQPLIMCSIGRLEEQKGFDRLIKSLSNLNKYNFKLNIIGEGSQKETLKKLIQDNGLENKIEILGYRKDVYNFLANSNLLICSSRNEGFSLVVAEAMCLGIPVLTTECAGPNELVDFGKYGLMVENSEKGLLEGLELVFCNCDILYDLHRKSLERSSIFNLKNTIEQVEVLLDE